MRKSQEKKFGKIVVAMSGGVDSSVAAALLKEQGFDVAGVFMKCWSDEEERFGQCTAVEDEHSARQAAMHLGIPFYTFDFTKEYKERVADYFIRTYASGRTPNPDVMCNQEIKFGVFFKKAIQELGADYVATGHYARISGEGHGNIGFSDTRSVPTARGQANGTRHGDNNIFLASGLDQKNDVAMTTQGSFEPVISRSDMTPRVTRLARLDTMAVRAAHGLRNQYSRVPQTKHTLLQAKDKNKDQSYFLYRIGQKHLARTLFPIGEYTKPQVRELAKKFGLPNADRPDSQGICFVGKLKVEDFLRAYIPDAPGAICNHKGERIGTHNGLHLYTIGQRRGIGVGGGLPYYVVAKDYRINTLHVAFEHDEALKKNECVIEDVHWIAGEDPALPLECKVRIRYRQPLQTVRVCQIPNSKFQILFREAQRAVTPGQSAVLYQGDECLGGGIIM